mgnify:CR=1 FL=1
MRHLEQMKDMKENNRITSEDSKATKLEKQARMLRNLINHRLDMINNDWFQDGIGKNGKPKKVTLDTVLNRKYNVRNTRDILRKWGNECLGRGRACGMTLWNEGPHTHREVIINRIKQTGSMFLIGGSHGPAVTVPLKVDENDTVSVNTAKFGLLELK